ncbi:MAG: XRE family transcriptional regulator, partial [Thermoplasmata archaeon]|nr:XRE family transcriptional regulator [Thermoplasmata archaeon]
IGKFDVVFSSTTLYNLRPILRTRRFVHFKAASAPGVIHAVKDFVRKPSLKPSPDMDPCESPYQSGELRGYYRDWHIIDGREIEFDCFSSGIPHRHALDVVMARRPG